MKVMILGISHISNLDAYLRANFDMNLANHEIRIKGFRGGLVHTMYTSYVDVNNFKPDTVILQIGSNDISDRETSVECCSCYQMLVRHTYFNTCTHSSYRPVFT